MGKYKDLTGKKFGRLIAIRPTEKRQYHSMVWECQCECGKITYVRMTSLVQGRTKSCGCLYNETRGHYKHGKHKTRLYFTHSGMIQRCYNPNNPEYHNYGERGILVCKEWMGEDGFSNFYNWAITNGYSEKLTIDRIDNNGNYEPSNCRWVSFIRNQNNKRTNHTLTYMGETKTIADWARMVGVEYHTLRSRVCKYGWSVEDALTIPVGAVRRYHL